MYINAEANNVILKVKFNCDFTEVTCKFIPWRYHHESSLNCSVAFGILGNASQVFFITDTSATDTVILDLSTTTLLPNVIYLFSVSTIYRNSTTTVEGTFTTNEGIMT